MGVIYKLKPEVIEFILANKKADPKLSCRSMVALIEAKYQTKVSKSSINALFKQSGLSMPVGRRRTKRKYTLKLKGVIAAQTRGMTLVQEAASPAIAAPKEIFPLEANVAAEAAESARKEAEEQARQAAEEKVRREKERLEAEERARKEVEEKAKREAEEKARLLAELKAKLEVELKAKEEAEAKAKAGAEARARAEAELKAKQEAELRAKKEAEEKARLAAEEKARLEAKAKAEAEAESKAEAEEKARKEVEVKAAQIVQTEGEFSGFGAIFLKAADYLMGGTHFMAEILKNRLQGENKEILAKTECLLYRSLFDWPEKELSFQAGLWPLIQNKLTPETYSLYLNELQTVKTLSLDMLRATSSVFQEVRGIKVNLSDRAIIYLDGQLHTVWSTVHIPNNFSLTLYNTKSYIKRHFQEDDPFVLFMAPGYDIPTKEFFDFICGLEVKNKWLLSLTLFGNRFEEIEVIRFERPKKRNFIFGLWPWQFVEYRQVKTLGEFRPFRFSALNKDFYLADVEIELIQPNINEGVTLRGCALKTNLSEKARLIILSDLPAERGKPEEIAATYLSCWPNLEEAFQDYSRKVELFTYTASSQRFFSTENLFLNREAAADISSVFSQYLKTLDLYVRWYFLPLGYEDRDFPTIKERFYDLKAVLKKQENSLLVTFQPPGGYPFLKDLEYACRRVNEKKVIFAEGLRLWLTI